MSTTDGRPSNLATGKSAPSAQGSGEPKVEIDFEPDDLIPTDATTDEVIAWHEGRGPCPWPR